MYIYIFLCKFQMHEEAYPNVTEIQSLEPSSRSSWTDNPPSSPLLQNYQHFHNLLPNPQTTTHAQLTNHQLHELVYSKQKVFDTISKCEVSKFVAMVLQHNNLAYSKIIDLDRKEERVQKKKNKKNNKDRIEIESRSASDSSYVSNTSSISKTEDLIALHLNQAERILEYAASCGKIINRKLIICILNNQASFYQKLWELEKACSYIEATVLNMEQWGQESQWSQMTNSKLVGSLDEEPEIFRDSIKKQPVSSAEFSTKVELRNDDQPDRLAKNYQLKKLLNSYCPKEPQFSSSKQVQNHIVKMCELSMYYLQYCSLCGQLSNHHRAIEASKKVIMKMKKVIELNKNHYVHSQEFKRHIREELCQTHTQKPSIDMGKKKYILGLSKIDHSLNGKYTEEETEKYRETARFYLKERDRYFKNQKKQSWGNEDIFKKVNKCEGRQFQEEEAYQEEIDDTLLKQIQKVKEEFKNFTIGNILQVKPKLYFYSPTEFSIRQKSQASIKYESQLQKVKFEEKLDKSFSEQSPFSFQFIFTNALLLSTGYFTLATELRLQAAKEEVVQGERFHNKLYKDSELFHLMAIIIISVYVPIELLYLNQLVTSYQNYYIKQISPIDEMQSNQYGNGPTTLVSLASKKSQIFNGKFDSEGIFNYPPEEKEVKELKRESRMVSLLEKNSVEEPNKKDTKKVKKSKSKSKSSRSVKRTIGSDSGSKTSFKNGVRREVKKINSKVVINPKKSIRINKNEGLYQIPYISISQKPRQSEKIHYKKPSPHGDHKKKNLSCSFLVKTEKNPMSNEALSGVHILNSISRSTNMLTEKSKSINNKFKYKNSSLDSNYDKTSDAGKDKEGFFKEEEHDRRGKKGRPNSKELRFQNKKISQYKTYKRMNKKQGSSSKLGSKSKSKSKSKPKESSNLKNIKNPIESEYRKVASSKGLESNPVKDKIVVIDQLNKKLQSTKKREDNLHSYFEDKETKKDVFKVMKKNTNKKSKNSIGLSNSISKKISGYKSGKVIKDSPKVPKMIKKIIPV